MAKLEKKAAKRPATAKPGGKDPIAKKRVAKTRPRKPAREAVGRAAGELAPDVLDRLFAVVLERRDASPEVSHSARLLSRGVAKVAQKFGEEAVECLIEAVAGNAEALVGESADVLYHMLLLWVAAGVRPAQVWAELERREGISGIAEKASRARSLPLAFGLRTTKIP